MLKASMAPLQHEAASLLQRYETQKRFLFAYASALLRAPSADAPDRLHTDSGCSGITALVKSLARRCRSPEVAFLRLMPVGRNKESEGLWHGRLSAEELGTGLLLGVGIDYPAVTGAKVSNLFGAIDQRGAGTISAADLASCCLDEWRAYGDTQPSPSEKLRALPWDATVGAGVAFDAVSDSRGSMSFQGFRQVVCQQLQAVSEDEARGLYAELVRSDSSGNRLLSKQR